MYLRFSPVERSFNNHIIAKTPTHPRTLPRLSCNAFICATAQLRPDPCHALPPTLLPAGTCSARTCASVLLSNPSMTTSWPRHKHTYGQQQTLLHRLCWCATAHLHPDPCRAPPPVLLPAGTCSVRTCASVLLSAPSMTTSWPRQQQPSKRWNRMQQQQMPLVQPPHQRQQQQQPGPAAGGEEARGGVRARALRICSSWQRIRLHS